MSHGKQNLLASLSEDEFRKEAIIPLLRRMGFTEIRDRQGPSEYGKDITFKEQSIMGDIYYAVVLKVGHIDGKAGGKQNIATIQEQVDMAFQIPIDDVSTSHQSVFVNRVIVWNSGRITNNAEKLIKRLLDTRYSSNVLFYDGHKTIDLLDKHYPAFFTIRDPYISDYYISAKDTYSRLEELYTLGVSSEKYQLPTIFVPPTLQLFNKNSKRRFQQRKPTEKSYAFQKLKENSKNTVIMGDAGSGKSTLLRRLLIEIIEDNEKAVRTTPIPVLLRLKKIDFNNQQPLESAIVDEFLIHCPGQTLEVVSELEKGTFIILLDGLDELETKEHINNAMQLIREFMSKYDNSRVILTTRMLDVVEQADIFTGFEALEIQDLTSNQIERFIENWYGKNNDLCKKLIKLLREPSFILNIRMTPLTLALVSIIFEQGEREMPANVTELFDKYAELALGRWDAAKHIASQFEWAIKEFMLRKISWEMHAQKRFDFSVDEFESIITTQSNQRGLDINSELFMRELIDRSDLVFRNSDNQLEFKHRSFQDYFVGSELNKRSDAISFAVENFLDPWWSKPIFFATGSRRESEDYIKAILEQVEPPLSNYFTYALHLGMLTQAGYLSHEPTKTEAVHKALIMFIESWDYFRESEFANMFPHLVFLVIYTRIIQMAVGSITLASSLTKLVELYLVQKRDDLPPRERIIDEWYGYLLGMSCIRVNKINDFIRIFESDFITDPAFIYLANQELESTLKDDLLLSEDKKLLDKLSKKFKRRIGLKRMESDNRKYISDLLEAKPLPLMKNQSGDN